MRFSAPTGSPGRGRTSSRRSADSESHTSGCLFDHRPKRFNVNGEGEVRLSMHDYAAMLLRVRAESVDTGPHSVRSGWIGSWPGSVGGWGHQGGIKGVDRRRRCRDVPGLEQAADTEDLCLWRRPSPMVSHSVCVRANASGARNPVSGVLE